jgi:ATP-dependent Clp protease ATP-binding subunit ClpC
MQYTDMAKKVIEQARQEAIMLNNDYIGSEHLLLGIIKTPGNIALEILKRLEVDIEALIKNTEEFLKSDIEILINFAMPFTPMFKKIIEKAAFGARLRNNEYIGTEHSYFERDLNKRPINSIAGLNGIYYYENGIVYEKQEGYEELNNGYNIRKEIPWKD